MQNEKKLTPPQQELENALASLKPAAPGLQRDKLMYRTGQISAQRQNFLWPAAAAILALMLTASIIYRPPTPDPIEKIVYLPMQQQTDNFITIAAIATASSTGQGQYIKLRNRVIADGVDALTEMTKSTKDRTEDSIEQIRQLRSLGSQTKRIHDGLL